MGVTVIEAKTLQKKLLRVAAYCRVSTDHEDQESSIENQKVHYEELINGNPDYEYAGIYYDHGLSGFKEDRPGFQKMMEDARTGKIDLIITKSITRFARNTDTILKATRELKELGIGVFFELQNLNTLTQGGELLMTIYAAFAQGESENCRELALMSKRKRFEEGRPLYNLQNAFGYRAGKTPGTFEIVPEEATIIKQIFIWVAEQYTASTIIKMSKAAGFKKRSGKDIDFVEISRIVRNETYKGDYTMQKTFTNEKRKELRNRGRVQCWYIENDHPAIVSRKLWDKANAVMQERYEEKFRHLEMRPMTEEFFPYKNKLFCGYCGNRLYAEKQKSGAQYSFACRRKECSPGVCVPQKVIESWGEIKGNTYITYDPDKPIPKQYSHKTEETWKKNHKKKDFFVPMKSYTKENYHYYKRIFCEKCGWPLYRVRSMHGVIKFICGGQHTFGKEFCTGVHVPEEVMSRLPEKNGYFILREEIIDGEKCYSYSCRSEKPERKRPDSGKED